METIKLIYNNKMPIKCLGGKKNTNTMAAAGIGKSNNRPAAASMSSAKYSNIALVMDALLVDHEINALFYEEGVYVEINHDKTLYRGCYDGSIISWEKDAPPSFYPLVPIFLYTLKGENATMNNELTQTFLKIVEDWNAEKSVGESDIVLLCDSFYYTYIFSNVVTKYEQETNSFSIETAMKGISSGLFTEPEIFEDIEKRPPISIGTVKKSDVKKNPVKKGLNLQACIDGEAIIPYSWGEKQMNKIPSRSTLEDYVAENTFYSALNKIQKRLERVTLRMDAGKIGVDAIRNDYLNFFIVGKPGTGKTTTAYALGAATGMPVYTIPVSKHTEEDTFEGMNKVIDGQLQFVETDFLEAYTNGGIIVIEEINLADPAVTMGVLGQAIEAPFVLKRNGYEEVRRHPMCVVIGTMNIGTFGSRGINQALSSRFKQTYILDDPNKDVFVEILEKQGYEKKACEYIYKAYDKICKYLKDPSVNREDICLNLSIRTCLGALQNYEDGDTIKDAMKNTFIGKIYEVDPELANDVENSVIKTLPNFTIR